MFLWEHPSWRLKSGQPGEGGDGRDEKKKKEWEEGGGDSLFF